MFSEKDNTLPMGTNCSLKSSTRTHGVILFLSESHTHTHFEYRMVQLWFLNEDKHNTGRYELPLKLSTRTLGVVLFLVSRTHTL